jgi:hypothetical protein
VSLLLQGSDDAATTGAALARRGPSRLWPWSARQLNQYSEFVAGARAARRSRGLEWPHELGGAAAYS